MRIAKKMTELIGNTPLLEVTRLERQHGLSARVLVKIESFNPAGSVKDRVALAMVEDALQRGVLKEGDVIIEPTSGNTGIGLAAVAACYGLRVILTMPETMSQERQKLIRAYGAQIVLTPGELGMQGAVDKAEQLHRALPGSMIAGQFSNPVNPAAHVATTGPEIWRDTDGQVDIFVAGVGTGGTLSGVGSFLKEKNPRIQIIAVEPKESPLLSGGTAAAHGIQGIGANFIPENFRRDLPDEIFPVATQDADALSQSSRSRKAFSPVFPPAQLCLPHYPLLHGRIMRIKTIVALLPDTGERYLSTALGDPDAE